MCLRCDQPTLAAGRCGSVCLQVIRRHCSFHVPSAMPPSRRNFHPSMHHRKSSAARSPPLQVTPSCVVVLRSLQKSSQDQAQAQEQQQQQQQQQPAVCWDAPQGHSIVLASFAHNVLALIVSHAGTNTVTLLHFSDASSPPRVTAFPCDQPAALRCSMSRDSSLLLVAIATYVQYEFHLWQVDLGGGGAIKLLVTKLPQLLSQQLVQPDAGAEEADCIINCIWMHHASAGAGSPRDMDVYLGSRSGMLHRLCCSTVDRSARVVGCWKLSDSPLEFVFVGGGQGLNNELLVVGEGQWLVQLQ